ncbi:MAG TPA: hypothetical protein VEO73_04045 [Gemmatimonadales bacterium]|nr:hypothetical protein [Gemmatimonadales bacterium]
MRERVQNEIDGRAHKSGLQFRSLQNGTMGERGVQGDRRESVRTPAKQMTIQALVQRETEAAQSLREPNRAPHLRRGRKPHQHDLRNSGLLDRL